MRIGIFGGTFNPPHNTHVNIVKCAKEQLKLDKVIVVPCGDPPHKFCGVDSAIRMEMAQLAFGKIADVSDYELSKSGKSYTIETLAHFREQYAGAEFYLIIGADSLKNFGKWHRPKEIARMASLVVADRGRKSTPASLIRASDKYNTDVLLLRLPPDNVSSTEIRLKYQFGLDNTDSVPVEVDRCVARYGLYLEERAMVDKLRGYLLPERFMHTFYVVKRGLELATDDEQDRAFVACLLHDCAKYFLPCDYAHYGFVCPPDMPEQVVHSFLGAVVARKDFGITDQTVLDAIAYHTTARPGMTQLDKLVYVADKTEQSRNYPLAHLTKGTLDDMFLSCLRESYDVCRRKHGDVYPLTLQAVQYYLGKQGN